MIPTFRALWVPRYGSHPTIGPIFVTDTTQYDLKNAENMLPGSASLVEDVP